MGIGVMCLIPLLFDIIYFEFDVISFVVPAAISIGLGLFLMKYLEKYYVKNVRLKHGMIISAFGWVWAAIIGGLVFALATNIPLIDAIFESMSALTGTGLTLFNDLEILPHSILFFRAFEQWIGGL